MQQYYFLIEPVKDGYRWVLMNGRQPVATAIKVCSNESEVRREIDDIKRNANSIGQAGIQP